MKNEHSRIAFSPNWKVTGRLGSRFLLLGAGDLLEDLARCLEEELGTAAGQTLDVGCAREVIDIEGTYRVVRVIHREHGPHLCKADLSVRRQGADLHVVVEGAARSPLRWLRLAYRCALFSAAWILGLAVLLSLSNPQDSLMREYVRKHFPDNPVEAYVALSDGWRLDTTTQSWFRAEPLSTRDIVRQDPQLVFSSLFHPALVLSGMAALLPMVVPQSVFDSLCILLKWPTPDTFNAYVAAGVAWAEGRLSEVLQVRFGIDETQKLVVDGK